MLLWLMNLDFAGGGAPPVKFLCASLEIEPLLNATATNVPSLNGTLENDAQLGGTATVEPKVGGTLKIKEC